MGLGRQMGRLLSAIVVAMALSAASAHAQLVQGNDTGGIIPWSCENEAAAKKIAANHCAWYQKYPRITSVDRLPGNYIGFVCLWNPRIGRFQIPEVPVRSFCPLYAPRRVRAAY